MLTLLDKYIIKRFLTTFFFACFLFTLISVVVDISERIQRLIDSQAPVKLVIVEYYMNFIPWINGILWPLFALLAVVFFTSRLAKNSEIIAILASGVSFYRLLRPYVITATLIMVVHAIGVHYFIPEGNKELVAFKNKYVDKKGQEYKTENIHIFLDPDSKIFIRNYRRSDTSMRGIYIEHFEEGALQTFIKANRMKLIDSLNVWRLSDYEIRTFGDTEESIVIGKGSTIDTMLNLQPRDFVRYKHDRDMMTTRELRDFIKYERTKGLGTAKNLTTELHRRTADSYTLLMLTIIGVAVAARKVRGGVGVHLAVGVSIGALYIVMSRFSITFANQLNIPIALAVWLPNILFSLIGAYLVFKAQK